MKYKTIPLFIDDMGSIAPIHISSHYCMTSPEEDLLWHINSMRDHDGLPHIETVEELVVACGKPIKTILQPVYESQL